MDFKIKDKTIPSGYYIEKHFYYSKTNFYQIATNGMGWKLPNYPIVADAGSYAIAPLEGNNGGSYFFVYKDDQSVTKRDSLMNIVNHSR